MLLALKNDDAFNLIMPMDVIHNSLSEAVKALNTERAALTEQLNTVEVEGVVVSSILDQRQVLALRPRMSNVNSLIEADRVGRIGERQDEPPGLVRGSSPCSLREAVLEMSVDAVEVGMNPDHLEEQRVPQRLP